MRIEDGWGQNSRKKKLKGWEEEELTKTEKK